MQNGGDGGAAAGAGGEGVGERDRREASVLVVVGFAFMAKKMDSMAEVSLVTRDTRGWRRFIFALLCHSSSASITCCMHPKRLVHGGWMPSTPLQGGTSTKVPTRVGAPTLKNSLPNPPEFVVRQRDSHVHVEERETTYRNAFQERSVHVQQAAVKTPETDGLLFCVSGKTGFRKGVGSRIGLLGHASPASI